MQLTKKFGFEYEIEKVISTHSFDKYQMSVITTSNKKGDVYKGIAIFPIPAELFEESNFIEANGLLGKPLVIEKLQAEEICEFVAEVLSGNLPNECKFSSGVLGIKIELRKFIEKWHGGGGYKGVMGFSNYRYLGSFPRVTISRNSLVKFRASLIELYKLDAM